MGQYLTVRWTEAKAQSEGKTTTDSMNEMVGKKLTCTKQESLYFQEGRTEKKDQGIANPETVRNRC